MSGYLVATPKIRPSSLYYADISACVIVILSLNIAAFCGVILAQEFSSTGLPVQWILFTKRLIHTITFRDAAWTQTQHPYKRIVKA